jgi:ABC-type histidine transport system ATPase subunit
LAHAQIGLHQLQNAMMAMPAENFVQVYAIHKSFGAQKVLEGVTFNAGEHRVTSLIGVSGSGKSTILRCINLLVVPDRRDVFIDGKSLPLTPPGPRGRFVLDEKQLRRIRAQVGTVFQSFNLWSHLTVLQNVIEGPVHVLDLRRKQAVEQAEDLLRRIGIIGKKDACPRKRTGVFPRNGRRADLRRCCTKVCYADKVNFRGDCAKVWFWQIDLGFN